MKKTIPTDADVQAFLDSIEDESQQTESVELVELMKRISKAKPVMYGKTIVGFGRSMISYADGREEEWFSVGFSPRKGKFSLYVVNDAEAHKAVLDRLGKYKHGKACIWVKRLSDIDMGVLEEMVEASVQRDRDRGWM